MSDVAEEKKGVSFAEPEQPAAERQTKRGRVLPRRTNSRKFRRATPMVKPVTQLSSSFSHMNEIGRNPGIEIWKLIDEDTIEKAPRDTFGQFQTDKGYLILWGQLKPEQLNDELEYHLHSWLPESAKSNDKLSTTIMQKMAELESILKEKEVVSHTEIQNHESEQFLSYFKGTTLRYVDPVKLKKVDFDAIEKEKARPKLYQITGRRNIRVRQVETSYASLNQGDVFILDCGDPIYQFNGSKAGRMCKGKALDLTVRMRDERGAKAKIVIMDELGDDIPEFWDAIGGRGPIAPPPTAAEEAMLEKKHAQSIKLYRVNDCLGELEVEQVDIPDGILSTTMLDPNDCFILDCETEIFVWVGKESSDKEKVGAMSNAREFLSNYGRPPWTPITKASQGCEPALFKDKFKKGSWDEYIETYDKTVKGNIAKVKDTSPVNVDEMHHPERYAIAKEELKEFIPSASPEESGTLKIWYIKDFEKQELPQEEYGLFFMGNCYLVAFSVRRIDGGEDHIIYFWQGWHATKEDKGSSALLARDTAGELGRNCVQARVVQNKEPNHFLAHFKGNMIVHKGNREDKKLDPATFDALFHIRGTDPVVTRAIQVDKVLKSFNSNDTFLLFTPGKVLAWHGKGTNEHEKALALRVAERLIPGSKVVEVAEGNEPEEFWTAVGEKGKIPEVPLLKKGIARARLFHCSNATGAFRVTEVPNFTQDDLDNEDVMILDAVQECFVWIGNQSTDVEKTGAMETAIAYIKQAPEDRADNPVYVVHAGHEPPNFTSHFHAWDIVKAKDNLKSDASGESLEYLNKLAALQQASPKLFRMNSQFVALPTKASNSEIKERAFAPSSPSSSLAASTPGALPSGFKKSKASTPTKSAPAAETTTETSKSPLSKSVDSGAAEGDDKGGRRSSIMGKIGGLFQRKKTDVKEGPKFEEDEESALLARKPSVELARLKQRPWPEGVNSEEAERWLADEDFHNVLKMSRKQWEALPKWKKINVKKTVGLF
eukprot:TRINITY_DN1810_c1_g1_i1.p1 TRINITY_DN1810_c1_g1~~TRINITY_DN1810_c1_g1_i1.p1  ORF type:complete len:998 (+),score=322.48 TRINITY_DN1810_c1_g1_i1:204-3197(+)